MTPPLPADLDRWQRIEAILDQVLDLPPAERTALLGSACAEDPELRAEVETLLAADAEAGGFLGVPASEYAPDLLAEAAAGEEGEENLAGRLVGRYRLLQEIGGGGMGTVYEAEDAQLGRLVAVKLLPPEYSRDRRAKERFLREARAAAAVDHPNLCTVHDVGESEGRLYIVLSFYEGETLRDRLRRGPLPLAEAREVAIQVARGLARAHEAGIVHRDIKPANVMLPRRGGAKILDFGIARLEGDGASLTRTGASWGTPAYMSPEQARGEPVDARTDVWSLGVMLYEMLAGRRPFGGESLEAVVSSILTQKPEPLERIRPEVPSALARVVDRALAKDPAERYASAAEILADLESGGMPVPLPRGHRRAVLWVSLLILLLVGAIAFLFLARAAEEPALRVAVLQPVVDSEGKDPELAFVASDVLDAALATLVSLEGVQPLDPPERDEGKGSAEARLLEADEALLPLLRCMESSCQVKLRRQKPAGGLLNISDPFEVQGGFDNAYLLAEGVKVHVRRLYSDRRPRPDSPGGSVRPEDYSTYSELDRRVDRGEHLGEAELDRLDSLLETSPGLVGAYVLATGIARGQGDTERALGYAARAEELAPFDPRPLIAHLHAELEGGRLDAAPATLARLESLAPGDTRVKAAHADLLEARGELEAAFPLREEIARRRPTWRNLLRLATLEFRLGARDSASRRLENLLAAQPDNQYVWENVAAVEANYGDLRRAATLYAKLTQTGSAPPYLTTNLGLLYYILGEYEAAEAAYRRALALDPDDRMNRFNLATTLEAQGDKTGAQRLYRDLEKELAAAPPPLDAYAQMLRAQCLARLGQKAAATALADAIFKQRPEDVQSLHQAAQIYAILGDRESARFYAKLALEKALRWEWLTIPEFRSQEDPELRVLLDRYRNRSRASDRVES